MYTFDVRRYIKEDKSAIKNLYEFASIHSEIGYRDGPWYKDLDNIEDFYLKRGDFLVGTINEEVVAIVGLEQINNSEAHIRRMRVHPAHRRKGYARTILSKLEEIAKKKGFIELKLRTSTQQKMAQQFYEKNGYKKMDTKKEYYQEEGGNSFEVIWYRKSMLT